MATDGWMAITPGRDFAMAVGRAVVLPLLLSCPLALLAQSSASYVVERGVINAGGNPAPVLASASYTVSLDAIGDSVGATGMASPSYGSDGGFASAYPPPGEVLNQRFASRALMTWDAEPSAGAYNVYRGVTTGLESGGYGSCVQAGLITVSYSESADPAPGECWFYLVTAENRLNEEGTSGYASGGAKRPITVACP